MSYFAFFLFHLEFLIFLSFHDYAALHYVYILLPNTFCLKLWEFSRVQDFEVNLKVNRKSKEIFGLPRMNMGE